MLHGEFAVSFFDGVLIGVLGDTQHFVEISHSQENIRILTNKVNVLEQ
jgi:hypothetical protein